MWYAAEREGEGVRLEVGGGEELLPGSAIDAVAIERRDRTRSSGYVEPEIHELACTCKARWRFFGGLRYSQTEVMPAKAPLSRRVGVSSGLSPWFVNHWNTTG